MLHLRSPNTFSVIDSLNRTTLNMFKFYSQPIDYSHVSGVTNPESSFSCVRVIRSRVLESRNGLPPMNIND